MNRLVTRLVALVLSLRRHVYWIGLHATAATLLMGASADATIYSWNKTSGVVFFGDMSNWTPTGVPGGSDTARFALDNTYTVRFSADAGVDDLNMLAGNVTMGGFVGVGHTLNVTGDSTSTLSLPNVNGGTLLSLGLSGNPLSIRAYHLDLEHGAEIFVGNGSALNVGYGDGGAAATVNGSVYVNGSGSTLAVSDFTECCFVRPIAMTTSVGASGGTGLVALQNGSTGNLFRGPLMIADDASPSTGEFDLAGGAAASVIDDITLATQNQSGQLATMYIDGANTTLTQTDDDYFGPLHVVVGSDAHGSAAIYVGTIESGGTLTTADDQFIGHATGFLTINKTGSVIVGSSTTTGTLNANGDVNVNGGLLRVYAGSAFNLKADKTLTIQNGGTADFQTQSFNVAFSLVNFVSGSLSYVGNLLIGTGGPLGANLTLDSTRQLALTGSTSIDFSHTLALTGGALHMGSLSNNGTLALGSGTLNTDAATLGAGGSLQIVLSGATRNTQYCALSATGAVAIGGSLVVTLNNFTPAMGNTFDILDGALSGTFSSMQLPALSAGLVWNTSSLYTTGVLAVVAGLSPADYNHDGVVDAADYTVWRDTLGSTTDLRADGNGDGIVNQLDYQFWKDNYPKPHMGHAAGVPEPSTLAIVLMATIVLVGWHRADPRLQGAPNETACQATC
jgi:hypothetical protein